MAHKSFKINKSASKDEEVKIDADPDITPRTTQMSILPIDVDIRRY